MARQLKAGPTVDLHVHTSSHMLLTRPRGCCQPVLIAPDARCLTAVAVSPAAWPPQSPWQHHLPHCKAQGQYQRPSRQVRCPQSCPISRHHEQYLRHYSCL